MMADKTQDTTRRGFLKIATVAVPGAVVAVSGSADQAGPAEVDLSSQLMQDTEHTRAYLDSARF